MSVLRKLEENDVKVCTFMQQHVLFVNILSRASSTSTSVTFRFPSRESFSVMMSEGTSSLAVSPSSSDLASQRSHGKMTVSEPFRERGGEKNRIKREFNFYL